MARNSRGKGKGKGKKGGKSTSRRVLKMIDKESYEQRVKKRAAISTRKRHKRDEKSQEAMLYNIKVGATVAIILALLIAKFI